MNTKWEVVMSHPLSTAAVTLSVRVTPKAKDQLDDLAEATGRTKSYLASEAIEQYLENQAWQISATVLNIFLRTQA